jgi:predicted SAM-dependent methyltransferase
MANTRSPLTPIFVTYGTPERTRQKVMGFYNDKPTTTYACTVMESAGLSGIKLHVGGRERREGWTLVNIVAGPHVDYVADCSDLSFLPDASCVEIYASHVLEHLGYNGDVQTCLKGFYRILAPGGRVRVSVPDLEILCGLFINPQMDSHDRFSLMKVLYGGRLDAADIHQTGFTFDFLRAYLKEAGFRNVQRVANFGEFHDMSAGLYKGHPISLNVEAFK